MELFDQLRSFAPSLTGLCDLTFEVQLESVTNSDLLHPMKQKSLWA
jgi:hypothetical protein